jgi:ribonuclease D
MSNTSGENQSRRPRDDDRSSGARSGGGSGSGSGSGSGGARGLTSWRSAHRARSHESAHAEDNQEPEADANDSSRPAAPANPLVPRGDAKLIDDQAGLESLIADLRKSGSFAYDTEFIGELTYHPMLCLVQVATTERVTLLDPMAHGIDLRPLWELLADESVQKIVHAGQQDVEPVARHFDGKQGARGMIDTQIAAGFAGMAYPVALSKLVSELIGVRLGKGLTFTHWDQRPLSAVQLRYAADDVRYLPAVWDVLRRRLDDLGHAQWAQQECEAMCEPSQFGFDPDASYARVRGAGNLSNNQLAVLRELTIWRDAAARRANVPARALVRDEVLLDMSRSPIKQTEKLARVRGLPRPVESEHGRAIVEATLRALSNPPAGLAIPRAPEPTPTERFRADSLYAAACVMCASGSIDPALVASRQDIGEFFRRATSNESIDDLALMKSWRRQVLGEPLLEVLRGSRREQFRWENDRLTGGS